jgi:hypothetical protein
MRQCLFRLAIPQRPFGSGRKIVSPLRYMRRHGHLLNLNSEVERGLTSCPRVLSWTELDIPAGVVQNIGIDVSPGLLYASAYDGLENANVYKTDRRATTAVRNSARHREPGVSKTVVLGTPRVSAPRASCPEAALKLASRF